VGTWLGTLLVSALLLIPVGAALQVVLTAQVDDRAATQALVVLNPARTWGDPDEARGARLDQAASLYRSGVAPVVVIAGPERVERMSRDYLMGLGVPDRDIVSFPTGSDTVGALGVVARVLRDLGWSSATIVTDPAHAARAQATASAYGIDAHMSPAQEQVALTSDGVGREVMALLRHYAWTRWSLPEILT
jgi:uncharacterized SAM-binding protein YcdF (DUF218 family)